MPLFSSVSDLYRGIQSALSSWQFRPISATVDPQRQFQIDPGAFYLWTTPFGETIVVSLSSTSLTGSERAKPQIRMFTDKPRQAYKYAKAHGLRYFSLIYCATTTNLLKFSTGIDPSDYVVSIESTLPEDIGGRLDVRSMYDHLETQNGQEFFRVIKSMHNCSLEQSAFIHIRGDNGVLSTETLERYLHYFDSRPYMTDAQTGSRPVYMPSALYTPDQTPLSLPWNLLVHGAPGTGKSHLLDEKIEEYRNSVPVEFTRVTFYEDYSYGQFVGEYMPVPVENAAETVDIQNGGNSICGTVSGERITYRFSPGPLAELLAKSFAAKLNGEDTKFILIIEELNRANAASVFGDIFQLLDRNKGVSIYEIDAQTKLAEYLYGAVLELLKPDAPSPSKDTFAVLRLPDNLYIWATMNSADQGVFPLDSAFKRRWSYIYRDVYEVDPACAFRPSICLPWYNNTTNSFEAVQFDWNAFRTAINEAILDAGFAEDRCVGYWFLSEQELKEIEAYTKAAVENRNGTSTHDLSAMPNPLVDKLFAYLLQDVFRNTPASFFTDDIRNLSRLRQALKMLTNTNSLQGVCRLDSAAYIPHP